MFMSYALFLFPGNTRRALLCHLIFIEWRAKKNLYFAQSDTNATLVEDILIFSEGL